MQEPSPYWLPCSCPQPIDWVWPFPLSKRSTLPPSSVSSANLLRVNGLKSHAQIINKDTELDWVQNWALGTTGSDWLPAGVGSIHHNSVGQAIQTGFTHRRVYLSKSQAVSFSRRMLFGTVSNAFLKSR